MKTIVQHSNPSVTNGRKVVLHKNIGAKATAAAQAASIKKWARKIRTRGFSGRDYDKILY